MYSRWCSQVTQYSFTQCYLSYERNENIPGFLKVFNPDMERDERESLMVCPLFVSGRELLKEQIGFQRLTGVCCGNPIRRVFGRPHSSQSVTQRHLICDLTHGAPTFPAHFVSKIINFKGNDYRLYSQFL